MNELGAHRTRLASDDKPRILCFDACSNGVTNNIHFGMSSQSPYEFPIQNVHEHLVATIATAIMATSWSAL